MSSPNASAKKMQINPFTETTVTRKSGSSAKGPIASLFNVAARLLLWYTVLTALFRCPSSTDDLSDSSARICKPYLDLRSRATPYVQPYYDTYLKSYVDRAQPHVENLNERVVTPVASFAKAQYNSYGAPRVAQLQNYAEGTWSSTIKPRLDTRRKWARGHYEKQLGPYVDQAKTVADPYLTKGYNELTDVYDNTVIPLYKRALPYLWKASVRGHDILVNVIFPAIQTAQHTTTNFILRKIWPQLVILYGENVEPQLTKIGQRLGRYKDSKKLQAVASDMSSIASGTSTASIVTPASSEITTTGNLVSSIASVVASATMKPSVVDDSHENIESDLESWKSKFATVVKTGSADLESRVGEIVDRQIGHQADRVGEALLQQLRDTVKTELAEVRDRSESATEHSEVISEVRRAGQAIKDKAQAVRSWKSEFDHDTTSLVEAALKSSTKIVENVRTLGLQQIGMRWAHMEGVTYEDWSRYHDLKTDNDGWRKAFKAVATRSNQNAKDRGESIQDEAMAEAQQAVNELIEIRDNAQFKIQARESSTTQGHDTANDDAVLDSEISTVAASAPTPESKTLDLDDGVAPLAVKDAFDAVMASAESLGDVATSEFDSNTAHAKSTASSVISAAKEKTEEASSAILGTPPPAESLSMASSSVESFTSAIADAASTASSKGFFPGAMAADVKPRDIVWDDDEGTIESVKSVAGEKYAQAVTAASEAVYGTPAPLHESVLSQGSAQYSQALSLAKEQYSKASVAVAGTPKPSYEAAWSSIESAYSQSLSLASAKLNSILSNTASVTSLWARPTQGTYESISSAASSRLNQGLSQASLQYEQAKSAVGAQPPPAHQQYLAEAQRQYYQGVGLAHDQYSRFLTAASTAVYGTPTPAYQSVLSAAQDKYSSASIAAQSVYNDVVSSASSVVGSQQKSPAQSILDAASSSYEAAKLQAAEALAAASASASSVVYGTPTGNVEYAGSAASEFIYGTETPWHEAAASSASANWEALVASASSAVYGTPTPWYESAYSDAGGYAAQATAAAAIQYAAVAELFGELLSGKEPDFTESALNRLSSAYHTGLPAYASSAASAASEFYDSASSVVTSVFTPPPTLEAIIQQASDQLNAAVDAASVQIYGTEPGVYEQASSAAMNAASKASTAVYGTPPSYLESAQAGFAGIGVSAQKAISEAIYGTPTGTVEAAGSSAASAYSSVSSVAAEHAAAAGDYIADTYSAASAKVSGAIYGPELSAVESAQARVAEGIASARSRLEELAAGATGAAKENIAAVKSSVEEYASAVSGKAQSIKDEL